MAEIEVRRRDMERFPSHFEVTVREGGEATVHDVTVSGADHEHLGAGYVSPEDFIRACFEFLLAREPKESILPSFDVSTIGRYFPEFERTITG